jgi:uncharacterized protein (DUF2141 family)
VVLFLLTLGTPQAFLASLAESAPECALRVQVDGLRNAQGVVGILLFRSPDGWPEDVTKSVRHEASPIADGQRQATILIDRVAPGDYGIVALHDENENMKLDRNIFGFPKEGFGFANNPHVGLRPPAFQAAVLHVMCPETETEIHIVYK